MSEPPKPEGAQARRYLSGWLGPLIVATAGVAMCAWSWGKWPDPVIDFGREVYVPWRLSEGEVLYRDIVSYFNGPLSPYAHALLFEVFGVSLRTLVIFNLILIALLATMLYRLVAQVSDDLCAAAAGVVFLVLFAFAQLVPTGNYNYVCPYSYELPHGITLTVAGITFLSIWNRRERPIWLALSGAMLGLVALTKAEVFLAALLALGAGLIAALVTLPRPRVRSTLTFFGASTAPPVIAFALLLLLELAPGEAMRGMLGSWRWIGDRTLTSLPYFKQLAGTDDIAASIRTILLWSTDYVLLLVPGVVIGFLVRRGRIAVVAAVSLALAAAAISLGRRFMFAINWNDFIRPAPLVLAAVCAILLVRIIRARDPRLVLPLTLVVWAGAMLAKMPLNVHVYHYGFALAMPATLAIVVILLGALPRALERARVNAWPLRATVLAAIAVALWAHTYPMRFFFQQRTVPVGRGGDRFFADSRGAGVNRLIDEVSRYPGETLVMLPEGLLVNFLARRVNPVGQLNFTPPAIVMYGEQAMVEAFNRNPPDLVGVLRIDTSEYGARSFGADYGLLLDSWITSHYEPVVSTPSHALLRRRR